MEVTVTLNKVDWNAPEYTLTVDGKTLSFSHCYEITGTDRYDGAGIFCPYACKRRFWRDATQVTVDFGAAWEIEKYDNPATEIQRRVKIVNAAFEEVRANYTKSWTVSV